MIEGLKIDLTTDLLRTMLRERSQHHHQRAETYQKAMHNLNHLDDELNTASNDPRRGTQDKIDDHLRRKAFFKFLEEHLIPDEVYRLNESDLSRLEILSRYF